MVEAAFLVTYIGKLRRFRQLDQGEPVRTDPFQILIRRLVIRSPRRVKERRAGEGTASTLISAASVNPKPDFASRIVVPRTASSVA